MSLMGNCGYDPSTDQGEAMAAQDDAEHFAHTVDDARSLTFSVGQRVRTTVDAPAAEGFEFSAPAGMVGTVTDVFTSFGEAYGVLLDEDPSRLSARYTVDELEAFDA